MSRIEHLKERAKKATAKAYQESIDADLVVICEEDG